MHSKKICCQYVTLKLVFDLVRDIELSSFSRLMIKKRFKIPPIASVPYWVPFVGN